MIRGFLGLYLLLIFSCNNTSNNSSSEDAESSPAMSQSDMLPGLPLETIQYLWDNCDYVDVVFYDLPISMSLDEQGSIRYVLRHIAADAAVLNPNCRPIGRIFYQVKGENALEADIYFNQGCTYYKFLKDNKPVFANQMTDEGINYFNDNIAKGNEFKKNLEQQGQ